MDEATVAWFEEYARLLRELKNHLDKKPAKVKAKVKETGKDNYKDIMQEFTDLWKQDNKNPVWPNNPPYYEDYVDGFGWPHPKWWTTSLGCQKCGIGSDGEALSYVCPRVDCPSKVSFY